MKINPRWNKQKHCRLLLADYPCPLWTHTWTARSSVRPWRNNVHDAFNMIPLLLPSRNNSEPTSLLYIAYVSEDPALCWQPERRIDRWLLRTEKKSRVQTKCFQVLQHLREERRGGREGITQRRRALTVVTDNARELSAKSATGVWSKKEKSNCVCNMKSKARFWCLFSGTVGAQSEAADFPKFAPHIQSDSVKLETMTTVSVSPYKNQFPKGTVQKSI